MSEKEFESLIDSMNQISHSLKSNVYSRPQTIFLNDDDTTKNKYIIIYPEQKPYKGVLFLIRQMARTIQNKLGYKIQSIR